MPGGWGRNEGAWKASHQARTFADARRPEMAGSVQTVSQI